MDFGIDFGYTFIKEIFDDVLLDERLFWVNMSYKALALSFFLIAVYSNALSSKWDWAEAKLPFDKNKLLTSFGVVLLIIFYDKLLFFLDDILSPLDKALATNLPYLPDLTLDNAPTGQKEEKDILESLKAIADMVMKFFSNPSFIMLKVCYGIFWVFDQIVYGLFLVERFFFLTILKILGPMVICLAIFEKFRDLLRKWVLLYIGLYLLAIPFFLVILITNTIMEDLYRPVEDDVVLAITGFTNVYLTAIAGLSLFLKYRLFKKSTEMVYKIFT